ncbi:type I secretion membrane fusion protein, HlyD family [Polaromonas sp. CF318]|nr:type I secretion membrane fusion protein, HlyD family [Polaromonas sp. CF318]
MTMDRFKQRLGAMRELLERYKAVFALAWQGRRDTDTRGYKAAEAQFLPAVLAVQETPVPAAPRIFMWLLIAFALIAATWSVFGKIDIVAVASGKIVPSGYTKVVQPLSAAVVKAIHVKDGQAVKAGDLLVELDATTEAADIERSRAELEAALLQVARAGALLDAMTRGKAPVLPQLSQASAEQHREAARMLDGQYGEYLAKLTRSEAEITTRQAELRASREQVAKLQATLPMMRQRASDLDKLAGDGYVAQHTFLERQQAYLEQSGELAVQSERVRQLQAAVAESRHQSEAFKAEIRRATLDSLKEGQQRAAALEQELSKAQGRGSLTRMLAPVTGTVQQLALHTVGGVVTPAQQLMVIVPGEHPLEVEAMLENKDIGFVRAGQEVAVKLETFPYTTYGAIPGVVLDVSRDAIADEKRGLLYAVRVQLSRTSIAVDGADVPLGFGMVAHVEIKTGQRRVISFFLSPLVQAAQEGLRER